MLCAREVIRGSLSLAALLPRFSRYPARSEGDPYGFRVVGVAQEAKKERNDRFEFVGSDAAADARDEIYVCASLTNCSFVNALVCHVTLTWFIPYRKNILKLREGMMCILGLIPVFL